MLCHSVLHMWGTKYEVEPDENILKNGMIHEFEEMCDVHEAIIVLVRFYLLMQ